MNGEKERQERAGGHQDADLERRFDNLSRRVYAQKQDQHGRPGQQWLTINQRQAGLDQRIDQGVRNGALTQQETILLRGEISDLLTTETVAAMEARMPLMESVTVPGVGHAPTLDEPEAVAAVERLLARVG